MGDMDKGSWLNSVVMLTLPRIRFLVIALAVFKLLEFFSAGVASLSQVVPLSNQDVPLSGGKGAKTLAFFIQVHKSSPALARSLRSVRRHLPDAPIYLLSDGGEDFVASGFAEKMGVHAERAPWRTHLAYYLAPHNFTCTSHLRRLAAAARWAQGQGAEWLISWEEDARERPKSLTPSHTNATTLSRPLHSASTTTTPGMLGPPRWVGAAADLMTQLNIRNDHAFGFSAGDRSRTADIRSGKVRADPAVMERARTRLRAL
jgi:hypothetical protein